MDSSIKRQYDIKFNNAVAAVQQALNYIRYNPNAEIDKKMEVVDICMKHLPLIRQALFFYKNTQNK